MKRLAAILMILLTYGSALGQGFNIPVGQETMANSMPVVISSDQSAVPVSGSITATNPSVGATGAAVPAQATYAGMNVGGNLTGLTGTANGLKVDGSAVTQPVSGTVNANQGTGASAGNSWTVVLSDKTNVIGSFPNIGNSQGTVSNPGIVLDTFSLNVGWDGSTHREVAVDTSGNIKAALVAGSAIVGKVGIDQTTPGTTNAVAVTNLPTTVDTNTGAQGASTLRTTQAGRAITSTILANNSYSSTNVTTSAYVQLIASTSAATNVLCISNTSGSIIKVATGAAASEVDRLYVPGGGSGCYDVNIAASTRISLEALDATASTGYFLYEALP